MERMSDERLAELDRETSDERVFPPSSRELVAALKAERAKVEELYRIIGHTNGLALEQEAELRAEVERLRARKRFWEDEATCLRDDLAAAESRLAGLVDAGSHFLTEFDDDWARDRLSADTYEIAKVFRAAITKATGEQT